MKIYSKVCRKAQNLTFGSPTLPPAPAHAHNAIAITQGAIQKVKDAIQIKTDNSFIPVKECYRVCTNPSAPVHSGDIQQCVKMCVKLMKHVVHHVSKNVVKST